MQKIIWRGMDVEILPAAGKPIVAWFTWVHGEHIPIICEMLEDLQRDVDSKKIMVREENKNG